MSEEVELVKIDLSERWNAAGEIFNMFSASVPPNTDRFDVLIAMGMMVGIQAPGNQPLLENYLGLVANAAFIAHNNGEAFKRMSETTPTAQ